MKRMIFLLLVILIILGFFFPWVSAESKTIGEVTKLLTGKKYDKIHGISGFQVPILANSEESRLMITIIKIFQPNITDADKKSYLIWLVPIFSLILFGVDKIFSRNQWVQLVIGLLGMTIFSLTVFKLKTTDLDKLVLKVNIEYGLWLILFGYLGIGLLAAFSFLQSFRK